jgi:FkbM family methyltransferase
MKGLPCPIEIEGLTLWYDAGRPSNTIRALATGTYEQPIADLLASMLRPGMTVLDVGAHIGYFSLLAAKAVGPTGHVWSFEPDPGNRASFEQNIEANGMTDRISVVPLAVASAVGEGVLHRVAGDTGSSSLYHRNGAGSEQLAVGMTSLDAWTDSEGWPSISLVKVDAEGAEGAVLAGMAGLIERNPKIVVILEFQADTIEVAGDDPIEFLKRLKDMRWNRIELLDDGGRCIDDEYDTLAKLTRRSRWSPLNLAMWREDAPPDAGSWAK